MTTIHKVAMASAVAISAFAFVTFAGSPAQAGPNVPPGHYCMVWTLGGSDCSFTSYAECLATASGVAGFFSSLLPTAATRATSTAAS